MGCGRKAGKDELVRLALEQHDARASGPAPRVASIDRDGRRPGRGAYLCRDRDGERPRADCLQHAIRRRSVGRTLRASVTLEDKLVESVSR